MKIFEGKKVMLARKTLGAVVRQEVLVKEASEVGLLFEEKEKVSHEDKNETYGLKNFIHTNLVFVPWNEIEKVTLKLKEEPEK